LLRGLGGVHVQDERGRRVHVVVQADRVFEAKSALLRSRVALHAKHFRG
jgi:hypothetical protein